MRWANFLHNYQPPTQTPEILRKVVEESYRRVAEEIKKSPKAKITINISGSLTELLLKYGYQDVIDIYRSLLEEGKVELVESAAYHPFFPKLPISEIKRQIEINRHINQQAFGSVYNPSGFFVPEMIYTPQIGKIIRDLGYRWILVDESSFPPEQGTVQYDRLYRVKDWGEFYCFFRDRRSSFKILSAQVGTGEAFIKDLVQGRDFQSYLLTGMDGETFGHHRLGLERLLGEVFSAPQIESVRLSDLFNIYSQVEEIVPVDGTWALFSLDEARRQPFSRWYDPKNEIHVYQWQLTDLAIKYVNKFGGDKARLLLDKALHSDQYWWASAKPWWNIDMLGAGAQELLEAVKAIPKVPKAIINKAEKLFIAILTTAFTWRKTGVVDKLVKEHIDEEARYRIKEGLRGMPKQELENLINHLKEQMNQAIAAQEYSRAAEFQKRIHELEEQRDFFLKQVLEEKPEEHQEKDWGT